MRKITTRTLAIVLTIFISVAQIQAGTEAAKNVTLDVADKITKAIWEDGKSTKLTQKEDSITYTAWSTAKEQNELVAVADYKPVAYAADLEEESVVSTDEADKITKSVWEDFKNTKLTQKEDSITYTAWSTAKEQNELVAAADYKPVAYAADLEEESVVSTDEADKITKKIW